MVREIKMDRIWIVKRQEEMDSYDSILNDIAYLSEEKAKKVADDFNKGSVDKYYVDYLDVDKD